MTSATQYLLEFLPIILQYLIQCPYTTSGVSIVNTEYVSHIFVHDC